MVYYRDDDDLSDNEDLYFHDVYEEVKDGDLHPYDEYINRNYNRFKNSNWRLENVYQNPMFKYTSYNELVLKARKLRGILYRYNQLKYSGNYSNSIRQKIFEVNNDIMKVQSEIRYRMRELKHDDRQRITFRERK